MLCLHFKAYCMHIVNTEEYIVFFVPPVYILLRQTDCVCIMTC